MFSELCTAGYAAADVRTLTDLQFHVADAALLGKAPRRFLKWRGLARRIVAANKRR